MSQRAPYGYPQPDPYARQQQYPDQLDDYYNQPHQPSSQGHAYGDADYPADHLSLHSTHSRVQLHQPQPDYPPMPMPSPSPYGVMHPIASPYASKEGYFQPDMAYGQHQPSGAYGQMKEKVMRRRSVKQVELQAGGHLVLDCPVPKSILTYAKEYPGGQPQEFTHMRYTACTVDPDSFISDRYTLRQHLYGRKTEMAIVVTMYNEDEVLFCRSFTSIVKNIQNLQSRTKSKIWGPDAWRKIVVVVVADGRSKVNKRTLNVLGLMGAYQDGIAKDTVAGKDVTAHIYEYSTQVVVDDSGGVSGGIAPVQVCFVLKEKNAKKLNSHRWFFNACCAQLNPNVCILIDAGTRPSGTSLHALHKVFEKNANVGGACGEITVDTGRMCGGLVNPLVAAQNFEYKMSNILDKPLESVFGYISVLPGAFSAYRYKALQGAPLQAYFLGEKMHAPGAQAGVFDSNMYLAEDRILCFAIVTKKRENWVLRYVKSAKASTDVPTQIDDLIGQRRRWLNGAFFAAVHATIFGWQCARPSVSMSKLSRVWTSGHNIFRKLWLSIEFLYNAVQLFFTLISLANFSLAIFFILTAACSDPKNDPFGGQCSRVAQVMNNIYIALLFIILICSLGNRPSGSKAAYTGVVVAFAVIFCVAAWVIYLAVPHTAAGWRNFGQLIRTNGTFRDIVISLASTYILYFAASFLHAEPWHMFTSFIQYLLGTKGQTGANKDLGSAKQGKDGQVQVALPADAEDVNQLWLAARKDLSVKVVEEPSPRSPEQKTADSFATYRTNVLLLVILLNVVIVLFFTSSFFNQLVAQEVGGSAKTSYYTTFLFWSVAGLSAFRFFGSTLYLLLRLVGH